ncbi:MAG: type II secretion system protein GspG [Nitrospira bacterium HGW-Nitrospira-1]|nr:MAG: type II secretion system protein GspG [Nitrospira bacterium HGW-Nitrospira-1]
MNNESKTQKTKKCPVPGCCLLYSGKGITLIELMVVILILGLLASIVAPRMFGKVGQAKQKAAKTQIGTFETALDMFRLDTGRYPVTSEGLKALFTKPSECDGWNGPYLKKEVPLDLWNQPYYFVSPGVHGDYDIYSFGADKIEGGEGENADVVSWK